MFVSDMQELKLRFETVVGIELNLKEMETLEPGVNKRGENYNWYWTQGVER